MLDNIFQTAACPDKEFIRPLSTFSDLICDILPDMVHNLEVGGQNLALDILQKVSASLPTAKERLLSTQLKEPVALLDMKVAYNFCTHIQKWLDRNGTEDIQKICKDIREDMALIIKHVQKENDLSPVLHIKYEDIILNNPEKDMRVFTPSVIGQSESNFYRGHQLIEGQLQKAIQYIEQVLAEPKNDAENKLLSAKNSIDEIGVAMKSFAKNLDTDHFKAFKPFFDTNPYNQEKGPSGAFSMRIPYIDALLHGKKIPSETLSYIAKNRDYFPTKALAEFDRTVSRPEGLFDLIGRNALSRESEALAIQIGDLMVLFRKLHFGAVKKHIGQNVTGSAEIGGAENYLKQKVNTYSDAMKNLKTMPDHKPAP